MLPSPEPVLSEVEAGELEGEYVEPVEANVFRSVTRILRFHSDVLRSVTSVLRFYSDVLRSVTSVFRFVTNVLRFHGC